MAEIFSHQALTQNEMDGKPIAGIALKVKLQLAAFLTKPSQDTVIVFMNFLVQFTLKHVYLSAKNSSNNTN